MSRKEFEDRLEELQEKVEMWSIVVGHESRADFTICCFFDNSIEKWKVYEIFERGMECVYLETEDEEEAFEELFNVVNFYIKQKERIRRMKEKRRKERENQIKKEGESL